MVLCLVYTIIFSLFSFFFQEDHKEIQAVTKKQETSVYDVIHDQELNSSKEGKAIVSVYRMILCGFSGKACTDDPADDIENYQYSMFGKTATVLASPYMHPPASGVGWAQDSLAKAGFIPDTYAATGLGFSSVSPFLPMWKVFRDMSYVLMVLVVISLGFLIMFRAKLDPQAVISIENSLPRIVIALILVTFSFAIAGFLIDMMYVLIGLSISILSPLIKDETERALLNRFLNADMGDIIDSFSGGKPVFLREIPGVNVFMTLTDTARIGSAIMGIFPEWMEYAVRIITAFFLGFTVHAQVKGALGLEGWGKILNNLSFLGASLGSLPEGPLSTALNIVIYAVVFPMLFFYGAGFILGILILFTLIFLMFKIFFMLFFSYLRILLYIIFAPFLLMFEAIPGRSTFVWWITNLIGELIMFPTVIIILLVGRIINNLTVSGGMRWQPPFLGGLEADNFSILVGTGIMFMIPELAQMVKEAVGAKGIPIKFGLDTYFGGAEAIAEKGKGAIFGLGSAKQFVPGFDRMLLSSPIGRIPGVRRIFEAPTAPFAPPGGVPPAGT